MTSRAHVDQEHILDKSDIIWSRFLDRHGWVTVSERQRVGAYALVHDDDGRVLLCRMSASTPTPGRWTLPGGGLRHGEAPEDAVVRELSEETGLRGVIEGIAGVHSNLYTGGNGDSIHGVRIIYRVIGSGSVRAESDETTDHAEWFTAGEVDSLDLSAHARHALT